MNKQEKRNLIEKDLRAFVIVMIVALVIRLAMFLYLVLPSIIDHEKMVMGGGGIIAFLYIGPLILFDLFLIIFFICVNVACIGAKKKNNYTELASRYRLIGCLLLEIWFIFAIAGLLIL